MPNNGARVETSPAKSRKWLRRLRIAVSVFFGLLTVALCVLWLRSYWRLDTLSFGWNRWTHSAQSLVGRIEMTSWYWKLPMPTDLEIRSIPLPIEIKPADVEVMDFGFTGSSEIVFLSAPYWAFALIGTTLITMPWLPGRFSLRTLLIATTLVALVLGLVVWLAS